MKIDKQNILDAILSNRAVADALSVKKVYVYSITEPDVWTLTDVVEACIAPWSIKNNEISLEHPKVRVIYKVLPSGLEPVVKYFNGERLEYKPYLYFSYGCGCFPTREECLKYGSPFVNEGHVNEGLEGISFDVTKEIQKVRDMFPEKLGYVRNYKLEFHPLKDVALYALNSHEVMRIISPNYEDGALKYVKSNIIDNNTNVGRLTAAHPDSWCATTYNHYCISNRIFSVDDIHVDFVMVNDWKPQCGDYGYSNQTVMTADKLWSSVDEYEEQNESVKKDYRSRQRFVG
jgi:hypothetical protein